MKRIDLIKRQYNNDIVVNRKYVNEFNKILNEFLTGHIELLNKKEELMQKMKRSSSAIGFAVYLDMLERFNMLSSEYDVDVLLVYSENSDISALNAYAKKLTQNGSKVLVCKKAPQNTKYREIILFDSVR